MSDPSGGRHPIDNGVPSEPKQAVVKVKPCLGCGGMPHGGGDGDRTCLRDALIAERRKTAELVREIESVRAAAKKDIEVARAEARELRWELNQRLAGEKT